VIVIVDPFVPELVQLPDAPNVTGFPEAPPVAETVNGAAPNVSPGSEPNAIVWAALAIENVRDTGGAGSKLALPAWFAVTVQVPAPVSVIVEPFGPPLVQLSVAPTENVTGLPEPPPVADTVKGGSPNVLSPSAANVIVCGGLVAVTVNVFVSKTVPPAQFDVEHAFTVHVPGALTPCESVSVVFPVTVCESVNATAADGVVHWTKNVSGAPLPFVPTTLLRQTVSPGANEVDAVEQSLFCDVSATV
jgi:hypothetical protein